MVTNRLFLSLTNINKKKVTKIKLTKDENKKLIEEYPFLLPRVAWTDEVIANYDYEYTVLDMLPDGWRLAFGNEMLKELREILVKGNCLDSYRIVEIKEKFGALRWYSTGYDDDLYEKIRDWENKYERMSARYCINCGKPTKYRTLDYILYLCEECIETEKAKGNGFVDLSN